MDLSVIIPVYNAEKTLRRCLDSILAQTFQDWQVIAVDDGSVDGSWKILEQYAAREPRIRICHQVNHGVSHARNTGLRLASGELVTFCDADDYVEAEWLQAFVDAFEADAGIVIAGYHIANRDTICLPIQSPSNDVAHIAETCAEIGFGFLWCKCFRRSIIEEHTIRFPLGAKFLEDEDFVCQYWTHVNNVVISRTAYYNYFIPDFSTKYEDADNYQLYRRLLANASVFLDVSRPSMMLRNYVNGCWGGVLYAFAGRKFVEAWRRLRWLASISGKYRRHHRWLRLIRKWNYPCWFPLLMVHGLLNKKKV